MNEVDQLPSGGFALFVVGRLKLSDPADWELHQFVFGLQPVIQVMPRLAAMLKKDFTGSTTDLFLGGTIFLHTPFLQLLSCWVPESLPAQHGSPFSQSATYTPFRKRLTVFESILRHPRSPVVPPDVPSNLEAHLRQ
jgi:hypothetical protein